MCLSLKLNCIQSWLKLLVHPYLNNHKKDLFIIFWSPINRFYNLFILLFFSFDIKIYLSLFSIFFIFLISSWHFLMRYGFIRFIGIRIPVSERAAIREGFIPSLTSFSSLSRNLTSLSQSQLPLLSISLYSHS